MIAIIDYGAGNLRSVVNAITRLGYQPIIGTSPADVLEARVVILPGVGAAASTMESLKKMGLVKPLRSYIAAGRPFFGVCLGLQVLFTSTEEGGGHQCLDVIPGRVKKLPSGQKVPHMGWNQVRQKLDHPVFSGIPDDSHFYFVHSYYVEPDDRALVAGETEYGLPLCSVIARDKLVATQFHPEKSGELGLRMYHNFLKLALE
ncbi:MAG: imidazole glycerol phosphate synthase subunit HisH [Dehalococcoidales bacterium]|nr:imidazole glycerol phosphate synthase subunit HisH [Dehalococcoidales bacterium]